MTPDPEDSSDEENRALEEIYGAAWQPYPYEDFQRHFEDVMNRRMENTVGDEGAFFRNIMRLKQYFDEFYEEPHSLRNHGSFTMILTHLSENEEEYDTELFGVAHGNALYVSEGLMRAVHWYFASLPRPEWGTNDEAVSRIKEWARNWIAENPSSEQDEDGKASPAIS